ncbi:MAG: diguanylate cyclase [Thermodesulfovibrio sp.]|nr:diguanylate cyclase [Thermodesulfovibrio sp.]MDW7999011.1 diguanylate cyclase [Thermodesulfovibrio sp.]
MNNIREKILIVDDDPTTVITLGEALKDTYDIFIATNGEEALKRAKAEMPDLILLDIIMPEMDGYEVCRKLKEDIATEKIPVIFITSKNSEEDETVGLELGAIDYFSKPFRMAVIKARIKNHLELKRKSDLLASLSLTDGLTGVANRRRFDEVMDYEWKRSQRSKQPLSVMLIDIDNFKLYNDNYGHLAGDECLKAVANAIVSTLRRATDFVARYGGEEFAVILPYTTIEKAVIFAEKIRKTVEDVKIEHLYSTVMPFITVSIGVASIIPENNIDYIQLIDLADRALYEAKKSGKNRVKYIQNNFS